MIKQEKLNNKNIFYEPIKFEEAVKMIYEKEGVGNYEFYQLIGVGELESTNPEIVGERFMDYLTETPEQFQDMCGRGCYNHLDGGAFKIQHGNITLYGKRIEMEITKNQLEKLVKNRIKLKKIRG